MVIYYFLLFLLITSILNCFFVVSGNNLAVIERFGKFSSVKKPGLNFKLPFIDTIKTHVTRGVWPINVEVETKTKDNVFVNISIITQCIFDENKIFEAVYLIPYESLLSYIEDKVRAIVPNYTLDELFQQKNEVAIALKNDLSDIFKKYGVLILASLITELSPNSNVKTAMNEINAAQRFKIAAIEKAEAEKIAIVKSAEAQAESKILQGKGIAGQRKAIIQGLRDSLEELKKTSDIEQPINEQEAITILLLNQYFDTLRDIGAHSKTNAIFVNNNPSGLSAIMQELKNTITESNLISESIMNSEKK